jgi:O-antigen ligase
MPALSFTLLILSWSWAVYLGDGSTPWRWSVLGIAAAGVVFWGFAKEKPRFRKTDCILLTAVLALGVLQLVPLPLAVIHWLSPHRFAQFAAASRVLGPVTTATLSSVPAATRDKVLTLAAYAIAYLLLCNLRRRYSQTPWALAVPIIVMGFLQAVLGIVQCAAGAEIATGTYVYRNHYAGLLEMSLPFAVMLGVHVLTGSRDHLRSPARPAVQACLCFGAAVAMLVSVIESQSRMGFTASMAALFVIGALAARSRHSTKGASGRRWLWVVGAVAMAGIAFFALPSGQLLTRFASLPQESGLVQEGPAGQELGWTRLQIWKETLPLIADYPVTGCGLGAFESCFLPYKKAAPWNTNGFTHEDYLQLMAEFGLPAFACLVALAVLAYGSALRRTKARHPARWLSIACAGALSAILLHGFADWNLYSPANGLLAVWVAAMARES